MLSVFFHWNNNMKFAKLVAAVAVVALHVGSSMAADWTVGANMGNVPWEFLDAQAKPAGFEVDLVNEVARRAGKTVEFQNMPVKGLFSGGQSNRIHIALSSIPITPKRLESVSFAQPYYDSDQSLTVLRTSKVKRIDDLPGKIVGVDTGSTGDVYVAANAAKLQVGSVSRYEGLAPVMLDLASGRIDGYISDVPAVQYYIKDKPQYEIVARIPTGERYSFMFAKNFPDRTKI